MGANRKNRYSWRNPFGKLKLMKLKKSSIETIEAEAPATTGGAFISARLRNPAEEMAAAPAKTGSDMICGVCAIVATIVIAVIAFLMYTNWTAIQSA